MEDNTKTILAENLNELKKIPDKYYDIAIIDPQYGIDAANMKMGENKTKNKSNTSTSVASKLKKARFSTGSGKLKNRLLNTSTLNWDKEPPPPEFWEQLFRISKNQIIFGGNYFPLPPTRGIIFWDKIQPWDNFSQFELIWTSFSFPAKLYRLSNKGGNNKEEKIHPTQKPIPIYDKIYRDFVKPDMKIIDTHLGSGSHRITAFKAGVEFLGIEKDEIYFNDQEKRFQNYKEAYGLTFNLQ